MAKYIVATVVCVCLILVIAILLVKNNTKSSNENLVSNEVNVTTAGEVTTVLDNQVTTVSEQSDITSEVVTEIVSESEQTTKEVVSETSSSETEAVTQTQATESEKQLANIKDFFLNDTVDYSDDIVAQALTASGLNEEQVYKLMRAEIFTKFADAISIDYSEENDLGNSEYLTGYSYSSYCDLVNYFFIDDANSKVMDMWKSGDVNGELKIVAGSPVRVKNDNCSVEISESSDSYIKIILDCQEILDLSELPPALINAEEVAASNDIAGLINERANAKGYYGKYFSKAEVKDDNKVVLHFVYTEEMVNTDDGWKISAYQDFRVRS